MSFILYFALYVLVVVMTLSLFKPIFDKKTNFAELNTYFNLDDEQTMAIQPIKYCAYAYILFALLGIVFPSLLVIANAIFVVEAVFGWFWLYETYKAGKIQIWFNDLKKEKV